jgi:stearoyl-CoA desaturase (delta-9 desaturase)
MKNLKTIVSTLIVAGGYFASCQLVPITFGPTGLIGHVVSAHPVWILAGYWIVMAHLTIVAMSLCFHRQHTHRGVKLNPAVDALMQIWLWAVTSMSKRDWVSVHVYHHAHSDTPKDPHSPVQKGIWHVLFLGVLDYTRAKRDPEVLKIRKGVPESAWEAFLDRHLFLGPIIVTATSLVLVGPIWGTALALLNFSISPVFAVGGVNALAHYFGYRNYATPDNSRNLGFLFPLNWIISGELDHNNHHRYPKSATFRHRWYEFDIGYAYLVVLRWLGLAEIKVVQRGRAAVRSQVAQPAVIPDLYPSAQPIVSEG